jgi:DNA-binding MarR family transcriptional regulator
LVELYFNSVGAAQLRDITRLFGWSNEIASRAINKLSENGLLAKASHPSQAGEWFVLPQLLEKM